MYTTIAYRVSVDAHLALTNITPVADSHVRVVGNYFYVPSFASFLAGAIGCGVTPIRAQLRSPTLRNVFNQEITPLNIAVIPSTPQVMYDDFESPISLAPAEPLECLMQMGAGAQVNTMVVFLTDGPVTVVRGDIRTIQATSAIAAVAGAWTNIALTFADTLPAGQYQLVGIKAMSTTMVAARALVPGQFARPGVIGNQVLSDPELRRFRYGNAGLMGTFMHDNPPTLDIMCNAADAAAVQFYWLDVIYMGKT